MIMYVGGGLGCGLRVGLPGGGDDVGAQAADLGDDRIRAVSVCRTCPRA